MNVELTRKLLTAAEKQASGFLNVFGRESVHEVELMAEAGYVDASFADGAREPSAVINRVTEQGEAFLHERH